MDNIWLKLVDETDDKIFCDLLIELANYDDAFAHPVPKDFTYEDFIFFLKARVKLHKGIDLPKNILPCSTYWVMCDEKPIGYATLKHNVDINKPGGHLGCCLKREYQNKGIGSIVSELLSKIAYYELGIKKLIYTSKSENIQSQKSLEKLGANFTSEHDGYKFYEVNLERKYYEGRKR